MNDANPARSTCSGLPEVKLRKRGWGTDRFSFIRNSANPYKPRSRMSQNEPNHSLTMTSNVLFGRDPWIWPVRESSEWQGLLAGAAR